MDSQDSGHMYFTNLLSQDPQLDPTYGGQSGNSPMTIDASLPLPPNEPNGVRKSVRGANFTPEEDKLLVSAWLNCSLDAVQGTDQKHSQLWEKIFEYFQQYKETTNERTIKSLIHRWSVIQKATNKFCAKLAQVEGLNQSGMTEQDKFEKAKIMYQSLEKCSFQFEHCWHLLKDQPKWIWRATKDVPPRRKTMSPSLTPTSTRCSAATEDSKAEKGKRKAQGKQAEENLQLRKMKYTLLEESRAQEKEFYCLKAEKMEYDKEKEEKKLRLEDERLRLEVEKMRIEAEKMRIEAEKEQSKIRQEDERLRLEAEKVELAKKESDQRIMMMDVSVMPEMQRIYFQQLQTEIMMGRSNARDLD
ncbi:hypothetical protein CIPAW_13G129900 [Carya illinoinensis]|uniref:No apical meristem-associated C-terminal domain-containing protein n=2 Tax=Carya illinoinensis TaxID=32201 RepID=A0A8T1NNQ8_CARIL|nr:hypothetical protein CIPAW_13G129900 [Carya illinoinensis]